MSSVEDTNLAVLVRHYIGNNVNVYTGLLERKPILKTLRSLDDPYTENLTYIDELIVIAVLSLKLLNLLGITNPSRNNPVNKGRAEDIIVVNPILELVLELPLVDVLVYTLLKLFAVVVYKLTGEDNYALLACLISLIKNLCELSGEAACGSVLKIA